MTGYYTCQTFGLFAGAYSFICNQNQLFPLRFLVTFFLGFYLTNVVYIRTPLVSLYTPLFLCSH